MGYFDSTKNKALWEIRLKELRKERAAREAGGGGNLHRETAQKQASSVTRVRVSYQELLKEEAKASERNKKKGSEYSRERSRDRERGQERQREARAYEKS